MSDFSLVNKKVKEGRKWRGDIRVVVDDTEATLKVRQLLDPEYYEVLNMINKDELQQFAKSLPQDELEEYRELQNRDEDLDGQERERFIELEKVLSKATSSIFDIMSRDTFEGIRLCAKYALVPDEEDIMSAFNNPVYVRDVEEEYGITVQTPHDLYDHEADGRPDEWAGPLKNDMQDMIDDCTRFTSFTIGLQALVETVGDAKNSKDTQEVTTEAS